jgi:hypothetical protein
VAAFAELLNPVHSPEKTKILEAIATHGPRIVPVDVAASTGMALPAVMAELNTIASETNAHLEVTEKGNIAYLFQPNLTQAYTANAGREIFRSIGRVLANISLIVLRAFCALMFFLVRISFGLALILGFVFIVVLVVVVVIALLKGMDSDSGGGDGGGFDFDFGSLFDFGWGGGYYSRPFYMYWLWDWIWDWFFFWRYVSPDERYYNEPVSSYDAGYGKVGEEKEKKSNFLMNVFSYLFGDGDPNKNFEELEWQTIAQVIEANQGVVTAEMLAPYAGEDPKDEDWMVHVLQRYNGIPEVTEAGGIVYTFPAFQTQGLALPGGASGAVNFDPAAPVDQDQMSGADLNNLYRNHLKRQTVSKSSETKKLHIDRALTKKTWNFMSIDGGSLTAIIMFGLTILAGSAFSLTHMQPLYGLLESVARTNAYDVYIATVLVPFTWAAMTYGALFFIIPGARYLVYQSINANIEASNTAKLEYAAKLANPSPELAKKLDDARVIRIGGMASGPDKIAYTTEKDAIDQETDDDYRLPPSH